jgi:hypothetical protein
MMNNATTRSPTSMSIRCKPLPNAFVRLFNRNLDSAIKVEYKKFREPLIEKLNNIDTIKVVETAYGFDVYETRPETIFYESTSKKPCNLLRFIVKGDTATSYANKGGMNGELSPVTGNYMAVRQILEEAKYNIIENKATKYQISRASEQKDIENMYDLISYGSNLIYEFRL